MVKHNDWIYKKSHRPFSFFILYQLTQHSINYSFKIHGIHLFHLYQRKRVVFGVFGGSFFGLVTLCLSISILLSLSVFLSLSLFVSASIFRRIYIAMAPFLSFTHYLLLPLALSRPNKFQAHSNWIMHTHIKKLGKVSMSLSIKKFN